MNAVEIPVPDSTKKELSTKREQSLGRIFFWPLLIGIVSTIGLVGALLEDGLWDVLFCALLAVPIAVGAVFSWRRR